MHGGAQQRPANQGFSFEQTRRGFAMRGGAMLCEALQRGARQPKDLLFHARRSIEWLCSARLGPPGFGDVRQTKAITKEKK